MKLKTILLTIALTILLQHLSFSNQKTEDNASFKSINIITAFSVGQEIGPQFRMEYENQRNQKLIFNNQLYIYDPISSNIVFDVGFGYGSSIWTKRNNTLYLNGIVTGLLHTTPKNTSLRAGTSLLAELEYQKQWKQFAINITPSFRAMYSNGVNYSNPRFTTSSSLKIGVLYKFRLK